MLQFRQRLHQAKPQTTTNSGTAVCGAGRSTENQLMKTKKKQILYLSSSPIGHCHTLTSLSIGCWLFQVSIYLIQIIFGAVDFPAKVLTLGMLSYLGRRLSQAACLFLSSLVIFANIFIPAGNSVYTRRPL